MTTQHAGETATEHNISFNLNRLLDVARLQNNPKNLMAPVTVQFDREHVSGLMDCIDAIVAADYEIVGSLPGLELLIEHVLKEHSTNDTAMGLRSCLMALRQMLIAAHENLKATIR